MRNALLGPAYLLLLPAIAALHVRHAPVTAAGAVLATAYGIAAVLAGVLGELDVDLRPIALFAAGVWWWTVGKLWARSGTLPRGLGVATAVIAPLAILGSLVFSGYAPVAARMSLADLDAWPVYRAMLAAWSAAVGVALWRAH